MLSRLDQEVSLLKEIRKEMTVPVKQNSRDRATADCEGLALVEKSKSLTTYRGVVATKKAVECLDTFTKIDGLNLKLRQRTGRLGIMIKGERDE